MSSREILHGAQMSRVTHDDSKPRRSGPRQDELTLPALAPSSYVDRTPHLALRRHNRRGPVQTVTSSCPGVTGRVTDKLLYILGF